MIYKKSVLFFAFISCAILSFAQTERVGIGTTSPTRVLHVEGDVNSNDNIIYSRVTRTGLTDIRAIETFSVPSPGYGIGGHFTGGFRAVHALNDASSYAGIETYGLYAQSLGTAGTRIGVYAEAVGGALNLAAKFGGGDVEVSNGMRLGTTSQTGRLNVSNANRLWGSNATALRVNSTNNAGQNTFGILVTTNNTGNGNAYGVHTSAIGEDHWALYSLGNNYMRDDLRIGTFTDPYNGSYKLIVDGNILSEEVRIQNSTAWPDYVFADDYALMPLHELEKSILKNHHLPNIPPASVIDAEGFDVGDIQVKMMEKIEEMTLYIIQLEKRITELEITAQE